MKLILETEGYETVPALSGAEALQLLRLKSEFLLILMDLSLNDAKTETLLFQMRKEGLARRTPIFFFSGNIEAESMKLPEEVSGFIPKPFEISKLMATIQAVENSRFPRAKIPSRNFSLKSWAPSKKTLMM